MLTMDLLDKNEIRNFIYDTSNKKLLIGSRKSGKTSSLLLALARNCSNRNECRPSTFIVGTSNQIRYHYDTLKLICEELGISLSPLTMKSSAEGLCEIEGSRVKFTTATHFNKHLSRGYKYKDTYIDEPNSILDIRETLDNIDYMTYTYSDPKLLIAGSSILNGIKLRDLSADTSYSRHVIKIADHISNRQLQELREMMTPEQFATEIECRFI